MNINDFYRNLQRFTIGRTQGLLMPETHRIVEQMRVPPRRARTLLIDDTVTALIDGGVWNKLDFLYVMAAHDGQAATINWKKPSKYRLVGNPALTVPAFVTNMGFLGNGTTDSLLNGMSWNSLTNFQLNSGHIGVIETLDATSSIGTIGGGNSNSVILLTRNTSNQAIGRINTGSNTTASSVTTSIGHFVMNRSGSATNQLYIDGVSRGTSTVASTSVPNTTVQFLRSNSTSTPKQIGCAHAGSSLTSGEITILYNALYNYMHTINAI